MLRSLDGFERLANARRFGAVGLLSQKQPKLGDGFIAAILHAKHFAGLDVDFGEPLVIAMGFRAPHVGQALTLLFIRELGGGRLLADVPAACADRPALADFAAL